MKKKLIIASSIIVFFIIMFILFIVLGTKAVDKKNNKEVLFTIKSGESRNTIISNLDKKGLIKNKLAGTIYININRGKNLQAATYSLNKSMSLKEILNKFDKGEKYDNRKVYKVTFVEGKKLTDYAKIIAKTFNFKEEDVLNTLNDKEYVKELINKYWFLTDEILDDEIYYPLEGYLFPNTYEFYSDSTIKNIIEKMLDTTGANLKPLESEITEKGYTPHKLLSKAAIIEKEANSTEDRKKVSQVIDTRIKLGMSLGMDVTAYYAAKKELNTPYYKSWDTMPSKYNTRNINNLGLPIGPICNPSLSSIKAALEPSDTKYVYFYAKLATGEVYFAEDYAGFMEIQRKLGV